MTLSRRDRAVLWFAALGPFGAWSVHLLAAYGYEEASCSTGVATDLVEPVVLALTVVLGAVTVVAGAVGLRWYRAATRGEVEDPRGRIAFMGASGAITAVLFLAIIAFGGIQIVVLDGCQSWTLAG
jgi:hypothetical protein